MNKKIKITISSMFVTLILLFPICVFSRINILKNNLKNTYSLNSKSKIKFNIPKQQDITTLVIIQPIIENIVDSEEDNKKNLHPIEKNKGTEEKYIILKISAHDDYITLANFPKNFKTIAQTNEGFPIEEGTVEKIHEKCGAYYLKKAIEDNMNIDIDKIIKLDYNAISTIINQLGGIKIPLKNIKDDKENYKILTNEEHNKILNKDPIKLLLLLKNNFNKKTNLSSLFATISNLSSTDISIYDFESRKKGFENMIKENKTNINIVNIKTKYENNRNKLTDECVTECEKMFK